MKKLSVSFIAAYRIYISEQNRKIVFFCVWILYNFALIKNE